MVFFFFLLYFQFSLQGLHLDIEMSTGIDDSYAGLVQCKRDVITYVSNALNWELPLDVDGCDQLDFIRGRLVDGGKGYLGRCWDNVRGE